MHSLMLLLLGIPPLGVYN